MTHCAIVRVTVQGVQDYHDTAVSDIFVRMLPTSEQTESAVIYNAMIGSLSVRGTQLSGNSYQGL